MTITRCLPGFLLLAPVVSAAQQGYRLPPDDVVAIADALPTPSVSISPDGRWMLLEQSDAMPSLADVARPWHGLAGMRVDPVAESRWRSDFGHSLFLRDLEGAKVQRVPLPSGARIAWTSWSHRSRLVAFTLLAEEGSELWALSVDHPDAPWRLTGRLSTVMGSPTWMPDGERPCVASYRRIAVPRRSARAFRCSPSWRRLPAASHPCGPIRTC
jgi:hypothetical protein